MQYDHKFFAAQACTGPVTWNANIKQMFTPVDIDHMKRKGIDLSSYMDVKVNAVQIYTRVAQGNMPPPGSGEQPWTQSHPDWITTFACWIKQNCPEG